MNKHRYGSSQRQDLPKKTMKKQQNSLRILMTTDTIGGVWEYSLRLARALKPFDIEIHLATMGPLPDKQQRKEVSGISNLELYESSYKLEWQDQPWQEIEQASMWLLYLEQQIEPQLVHLNNYTFGELPFDSPVLVVGHSCMLSQWKAVNDGNIPEEWQTYQERVNRGLKSADFVVAVSQWMKRELEKYYGPFENSEVIYDGISVRRNWEKKKEERIFSFSRYWDEGKNPKALISIADRLPFSLAMAGKIDKNMAKAQQNLHLPGNLSSQAIEQWLDQSLFFVSPTLYEPFGMEALEAAERGCVLLLSDIETHHEIWQDHALYFDPKNPESLLEIINQLAGNKELTHQMQDKARARAAAFKIKKTANTYYQLYMSLLHPLEKYDLNEQTFAN